MKKCDDCFQPVDYELDCCTKCGNSVCCNCWYGYHEKIGDEVCYYCMEELDR